MIENLYHITSIKNLDSILKHGLLSRQELVSKGIIFHDVANKDILSIRSRIFIKYKETIRRLNEYVPLFFAPKRPMLYKIDFNTRETIIYLEINTQIIKKKETLFTDGIATTQNISQDNEKVTIVVSENEGVTIERIYEPEIKDKEPLKYRQLTNFYIGTEHLNEIGISTIARGGTPISSEDKRMRQAEVLVLNSIPLVYLSKISVKDEKRLTDCKEIIEKSSCRILIIIKPEYFI